MRISTQLFTSTNVCNAVPNAPMSSVRSKTTIYTTHYIPPFRTQIYLLEPVTLYLTEFFPIPLKTVLLTKCTSKHLTFSRIHSMSHMNTVPKTSSIVKQWKSPSYCRIWLWPIYPQYIMPTSMSYDARARRRLLILPDVMQLILTSVALQEASSFPPIWTTRCLETKDEQPLILLNQAPLQLASQVRYL